MGGSSGYSPGPKRPDREHMNLDPCPYMRSASFRFLFDFITTGFRSSQPTYSAKIYFDASDLSYEPEDAVICRVKAALDEPLRSMIEVRNQARVHLWFEGNSASRTGLFRARLRLWSALPQRHSRSASDSNPTTGSISRLPLVSPICSGCV